MIERDDHDEPYDDGFLTHAPAAGLPVDLVRVIDWVRGNLAEPINLEQLAAVAGVRQRTLESHFRLHLGTTPLRWVRRMRLVNARRDLSRGRPHARVTDIALASGFSQLGRFAAHYRSAFGEQPSVTLRRGQRGSLRSDTNAIDNEAFRLTWQAMPQVFAIAPRECSEALDVLEEAQRLAPDYGLPAALAAWCWGQRAAHGFSTTPVNDRDHGLQLVTKACELAPNDALALTLASGALTLAHRLDEADRLLERVLALDPWLPYAWVRRGWASVYMGDPEAAYRELKIALYLSPLGPMRHIASIGMGCAYFASEQYEEAASWVQGEAQVFPGAVWANRVAVAAAVHAGAAGEARRMARRLMRNDPNLTVASARRAWPFPAKFMSRLADGLKLAGVPRR
jgi:AraC-like DNA-binding protein